MTELCLAAPAKVNLTLEVLALLDNGYHELDTVFAWLELADELCLSRSSQFEFEVEGGGGGFEVPKDESNLVVRAHRLLEQATSRTLPVRCRLVKRLPAGGGLGGGSADAAAMLWGMDRLFQLGLGQAGLLPLAARLGADVAFGLVGGVARGRGVGERLEPLPFPPSLPVVLLCPEFGCSTPEVYACWDRSRFRPAAGRSEALVEKLQGDVEGWTKLLQNDLEPAAFEVAPGLRELHRQMGQVGFETVRVSGSGSTLFGLMAPGEDPEAAARKLRPYGRVLTTRLATASRTDDGFS